MISEKIKSLREINKFTQSELAKKLGITRSSVNAWEMGVSIPSTQYIVELSHLFKVSTDYLLTDTSEATINVSGLTVEQVTVLSGLIKEFNKMDNK